MYIYFNFCFLAHVGCSTTCSVMNNHVVFLQIVYNGVLFLDRSFDIYLLAFIFWSFDLCYCQVQEKVHTLCVECLL